MESHTKIFLGYLLPVITGLTYFYIKEEEAMLLIFVLLVLIGLHSMVIGMVGLEDKELKARTKLRDGDYKIMSTPVMEMRKGTGSFIYLEDANKFDLQDAVNVISVRLHLHSVPRYFNEPMKFYEIPAEKIPARFWTAMMLPGNVMEVKDNFVRNIYKPGE